MKKHNTFKIVLGTLLVFAILSWIIPAAYYSGEFVDQGRVQVGLFDLFNYSLTSLSYFGYIGLFLIFVGGFYGILNKIPAYRNLLDAIAKGSQGKEKVILSIIMVLLAVIVSVWGIEIEMLLFVPFIISVILFMGFDKMVAALAVAGSSLVGVAGSTYAYGKIGMLTQTLGVDITSDIYVKLMILLVGLVLLIFNTLLYIKKSESVVAEEVKEEKVIAKKITTKKVVEEPVKKEVKTTKAATSKSTKTTKTSKTASKTTKATAKPAAKKTAKKTSKNVNKAAVKGDEVIVVKNGLIPGTFDKKQNIWPMAIMFILLLVLVLLAFFPWSSVFNITWFEEASKSVSEFTLFEFPIFGKLFGTFNSFGGWMSSDLFLVLVVFTLILALIYKVRFNDLFEGFAAGAKKAIGPAGIVLLVYTILVLTTYHPFQLTIYKTILGLSEGFNIATASLVAILAALFNGDASYAFQSVLPYFTSVVTNSEFYSSVGVLFQALYGVTMLVAPTSLMLMIVLTYLDIPYLKWLKSTWKFILEFFAIIMIVVVILVLL